MVAAISSTRPWRPIGTLRRFSSVTGQLLERLQSSPAATAGWVLRPVGNSEDWASRSFFVVAIHRLPNTPQPSFGTRAQVSKRFD